MNMKKFLSILIVPLVAVLMLCGCGRTMRTVEDITQLFEQNKAVYNEASIQGNDTNNNWYFKDGENKYMMRVVYDNEAGLNKLTQQTTANMDSNIPADLKIKYEQLRTVYERELALIYAYYNYYADTFYANAKTKEVTEEELTNLYDKVRDMFKQLESFNSSKTDLEREVKLYGNNSSILIASIDKFNSAYNGLVRKSLDMVEYFRDLHYNYFFKGTDSYDDIYLRQMHYDSLLTLAEYIYNDYLVPLTKNGVVSMIDVTKAISAEYNIFANAKFNNIVRTTPVSVAQTKTSLTVSEIKQFENSLNSFKQYYTLYLKAFANINVEKYYDYRYARNGVVGTYEDSLDTTIEKDVVEKANIQVVHNFEKEKVTTLLNVIEKTVVVVNI